MAFSPDGKRLASASNDGTVKVWDAATGQETLTLKGHTRLGLERGVQPRRQAARLRRRRTDGEGVGRRTGQETLTLKGHTGEVGSVAFSPDGKRLATASGDGTVKVWDAATGQETLTLKGHTSVSTSVAFSPDGKRLASASRDETVKVWDAATGQETLTLKGHTSDVRSVAFSPDGKRLASASDDRTVKVWDAATGQETLTLKGHNGHVTSVAFSPDGKRLASASVDRTVKVWDAEDRAGGPHSQGTYRRCPVRGIQPGWQSASLRQYGWDGEGVGRPACRRRAGETRPEPTLRESVTLQQSNHGSHRQSRKGNWFPMLSNLRCGSVP